MLARKSINIERPSWRRRLAAAVESKSHGVTISTDVTRHPIFSDVQNDASRPFWWIGFFSFRSRVNSRWTQTDHLSSVLYYTRVCVRLALCVITSVGGIADDGSISDSGGTELTPLDCVWRPPLGWWMSIAESVVTKKSTENNRIRHESPVGVNKTRGGRDGGQTEKVAGTCQPFCFGIINC